MAYQRSQSGVADIHTRPLRPSWVGMIGVNPLTLPARLGASLRPCPRALAVQENRTVRRTIPTTAALAAVLTTALAGIVTVLIGLSSPALAGRATPGSACDRAGQTTTIDTRDGRQTYRCEQRPGEDCPHWHWVYNPGVPRSQWTPRPAGPCPTCPTPGASSPTSTTTRTTTHTGTRPASTPADSAVPAAQLPVTDGGVDPFILVGVAGALLFLGGCLVLVAHNASGPEPAPATAPEHEPIALTT